MENQHDNHRIEIPISNGDDDVLNSVSEREVEAPRTEKAEADLTHDQLQRLQAEFLNYKRRVEREKEEIGSFARGNLIRTILPVLDDLGRLIGHHGDDESVAVESVQLILQKFNKILTDEGLETIESCDAEFDPEIHEALSVEAVPAEQDGKILEEWEKGYRYHGRLLRPSRVKVGKAVSADILNQT